MTRSVVSFRVLSRTLVQWATGSVEGLLLFFFPRSFVIYLGRGVVHPLENAGNLENPATAKDNTHDNH